MALQLQGAKERFHGFAALGMTFLAGLCLIVGQSQVGIVEQFLEHLAAVFEERFAQAQFDGLQVANALLRPLLANDS
jgi:hypothetical protein